MIRFLMIFTLIGATSRLLADTDLIVPWITNQPQFGGTLILNNTLENPADITVTATRPEGQEPGGMSIDLELKPFEQRVLNVADAFADMGQGSGFSARITSDSIGVTGAFVVLGRGAASGSSPAQGNIVAPEDASSSLLFDYMTVRKDGGYTGMVVINMGDEPAEVELFAYQNGTRMASNKTTIQPNRPFSQTTEALFPGLAGDIYAVAHSNQPLLGVAFLFNQYLEPSMANARALTTPVTAPDFEAQVSTSIPQLVGMDAIIVGKDNTVYGAGGFNRDYVVSFSEDGVVKTLATGLGGPVHLIQDKNGDLLVSEFISHEVSRIDGQGNATVIASGLDAPTALAYDDRGDLWIANYGRTYQGTTISKLKSSGEQEIALNDPLIFAPIDLIFHKGNLYIANQGNGRILKATPNGEVIVFAQVPTSFLGHMILVNDLFYVTAAGNHSIYTVDLNGEIKRFAGSGAPGQVDGPASTAQFNIPNGLAPTNDDSAIFVTNGVQGQNRNNLRKVTLK